ncbi:MAG TPA: enoyl-CoA hydratase-related protein [Thermoanaerobaculia bacterium]|nr:enoyl-CoA hydratase-related protein [Thermoanaerobaculia bacterium]
MSEGGATGERAAPGQEQSRYELRATAAWITLHRPAARNALSARLVHELYDHLQRALADDAVRCVVITGEGTAFCAGADLKDPLGRTDKSTDQSTGGTRSVPYSEVLRTIWHSPKPVIAAVNGAAFAGGLGLVGAADIVITAEDAVYSFSEVRIGVIPAIISVVCLPKVGAHHAMRLFLGGHRFDGAEAVRIGLAHRAVPRGRLLAAVEEEIEAIHLGGPTAVTECKKLVRTIPHLDLESGFELATGWSRSLFAGEEAAEGMRAFREKRPPRWAREQATDPDRER